MGSLTFWQPLLPALGSWSEELIVQRWTTQLHQTICPNLEYITKQTVMISWKGQRPMLCCVKTERELQCCYKSLYNQPLFQSEEQKPSLESGDCDKFSSSLLQPKPILLCCCTNAHKQCKIQVARRSARKWDSNAHEQPLQMHSALQN